MIGQHKSFFSIVTLLFGLNALNASTPMTCEDNYYFNRVEDKNIENSLKNELKKNPNDVSCIIKLASYYLKNGYASKGFRLISKAYSIDPQYVKSKNIAKILDLALRLTRLEDLAKKSNDKRLFNELGKTYYDMGIFTDALEAFKSSLLIDPNQIDIKVLEALCLGNTGHMKEAAKILKEVLDKKPYHFYANYYYGKILKNELNKEKEAQAYLMAAEYVLENLHPKFKTDEEREFIQRDLTHELKER
ncbi:MAG: hypothetical protein DSZ06_03860 [Sulfurospirillum sp.]|nr:MAG: hypothetical protein DSZ06_03860 [Sulfurospirillum sp.]